jgi:hypothetical protein
VSICNLAVEFNGLVSKNGEQKCLAFLLLRGVSYIEWRKAPETLLCQFSTKKGLISFGIR